jgi:chloramphenicol-sensitive protein RarD
VTEPVRDPHEKALGIRVGLAAYLIWGLLVIFWKHLDQFNALELIGWRIASSAVVMTLVLTVTHRWGAMRTVLGDRRLLGLTVVAALLLTGNWGAYLYAVVHDHVLETALGYFMAPLGTMALGVLVLGERMTRLQRIAAGLAIVAVAILTVANGRPPIAAIIIAVTWSFYGLCKQRTPLTGIESFAAETFSLVIPAVIVVAVRAGATGSVPAAASAPQLVLVALTGLATAIPLILFAYAAPRVPFTLLGPMQYLVPIINFGLGWLIYGEELPWEQLVGFAFVWVALALVTYDRVHSTLRARRQELIAVTD